MICFMSVIQLDVSESDMSFRGHKNMTHIITGGIFCQVSSLTFYFAKCHIPIRTSSAEGKRNRQRDRC